jgi:hypothetical protein
MARTLTQLARGDPRVAHNRLHQRAGEGLNSLIKKIRRVAAGFRSFTNYRLRIVLACGGCHWNLLGTPPR